MLFCFVMTMPGPEKFGLLLNGGVHTASTALLARVAHDRAVYHVRPDLPAGVRHLQLDHLPGLCPNAPFADAAQTALVSFLTPYAPCRSTLVLPRLLREALPRYWRQEEVGERQEPRERVIVLRLESHSPLPHEGHRPGSSLQDGPLADQAEIHAIASLLLGGSPNVANGTVREIVRPT